MLVEGLDEITMALAAGCEARLIVTAPDIARGALPKVEAEMISVSLTVFGKLAYRDNPDGWLAVFDVPTIALEELKLGRNPLLVAAESVEKPGNLGAILRTADAAGVDGILVCDSALSVYSPNVVRASRGTLFTVPVAVVSSAAAIAFLKAREIRILAATPAAQIEYTDQDLRGPLAIAVGAEDKGLSPTWLEQADVRVRIPMAGKVNSLNVSVATALIIYEAARQRRERG